MRSARSRAVSIAHEGKIGHAELEIGQARHLALRRISGPRSPEPANDRGTPVMIHLYVEDVDVFTARAVEAGLKVLRPVADQFYGDRGGKFEDPFGHRWWIATRKENLPPEELKRRAAALFGTCPD